MNARSIHVWPCALALGAVLLAAPALAQDQPWPPPAAPPDSSAASEPAAAAADTAAAPATTPPPPAAPVAEVAPQGDTLLALPSVLTLRSKKELDAEQARMTDLVTASLNHASARKSNASREQAEVDVKKGEISDISKAIGEAKKEKRDGDKKRLEADKKKLEAQQKYLEKVRDWHNSEADYQTSLANYAQARIEEARAEMQMIDLGDLSTPEARQKPEARNAAARVLTAIKARADMGSQLASDERTAVSKRKGVLDAYTEMSNR